MLHWHLGSCSRPKVLAQKENLVCKACGESISHQSPLPDHRKFRSLSQEPLERACLDLKWPANVKYTRECILQDGGPDLTETLANHLGRPSKLISESGRLEHLSRYGFPTLPSGQHIRVLLLSPARRWGHPLHGYLQVQDLNGRPHYEALSYSWADETGDASLNRRMYIGPAWDVMPVTRSCSRALRRLRLDEIPRPIWVDAVCINQLNSWEKSHQIALVRAIYARSIRCVVDLGEPTSGSDRALDRVNGNTDKEDYVPASGQSRNHGDTLDTLFRRPYFRRIWTIQEVTSAHQVEVACGSRSTDLRLLKTATSLKPPWMAAFGKQIETFHPTGCYEGPEGLLRLFMDTRESESSDPRDKIFALLGLMKDHNKNGALVADYDFTYAQICTGLAAYYLQHPTFHYIICLQGTRLSTLPSWVPNWGSLQKNDWDEFHNLQVLGEPLTRIEQWEDVLKDVDVLQAGDSLGILRLQTHDSSILLSPAEESYVPRVHSTTGALIQEVAFVFGFGHHMFRKNAWNICNIPIFNEEKGGSLKIIVSTSEPVDLEKDTLAVLRGQRKFFQLRKGDLDGTYHIVGDAMLVLYECSQKKPLISTELPRELPRELSYWQGPLTAARLYDDHVSQWCQSSVDTGQVWELFVDPSGSKGITLVSARQRQYANSPAYLILYRAMNLEEAHTQYLILRERHGGGYNIMRQWVQNHGRLEGDDGSVAQLIECVLYWSQSHAWDDLDGPTRSNVSPMLISTHLNAWINANIVRQRWLGVESILASKHHLSLSKPGMPARTNPVFGDPSHLYSDRSIETIIALWEDLTDNLICRLNAIADIAGLAPSLFETESPAAERTSQGGFLDESFRQVTSRLEEFYKPVKSRHNRADSSRSKRPKPKSLPLDTPSPLSVKSSISSTAARSSRHSSPRCSMDEATTCFACVDLQDTKGAVEWQAHWKVPRSRSALKAALEGLHIQHYGDRRRWAVADEPLLRKHCLKLGMLTDLAVRSLNMETVAIL